VGQPAAKEGDQVVATDTHIVIVDGVPTPEELPFTGIIDSALSRNVFINSLPAATIGSGATNEPPHIPEGGAFQQEPTNRAAIMSGSGTVRINGKGAARAGDSAQTCNDPAPQEIGKVVAKSDVLIGD
jgi:uncharacterized Zn-binding protein involved in type VI secretion